MPAPVDAAIAGALGASVRMPTEALALYARWWQVESWLRSLAYIELRAKYGMAWTKQIDKRTLHRTEGDRAREYMTTSDRNLPLAYLDASLLFRLLADEWDLFEGSLIEQDAWTGRTAELLKIRNRIGHLRRPHADDLSRIDQTLRDLGPGGRRATAAYANLQWPEENLDDPVVAAWIRNEHETADRLVGHAYKKYETSIRLWYSQRPWAKGPQATLTGQPGVIWHAVFTMRGRGLNLGRFWDDVRQDSALCAPIIHVLADSPAIIRVTFAAVDDGAVIANAIGHCFDALLLNSDERFPGDSIINWPEPWIDLDPRVQVRTPWSLADGYPQLADFFAPRSL